MIMTMLLCFGEDCGELCYWFFYYLRESEWLIPVT